MVKVFYTFLLVISHLAVHSQQFTEIKNKHIVNTDSDSRSCNFVDVNGDMLDDIFISNGPSSGENNMLYLNKDGEFTLVTNNPVVLDKSKSDGATFGDVDNDGDLDLFVTTWYGQRNYFYRNLGDANFDFESATINNGGTYSETASFGDYDQDGWLDIYVTNSTDFSTNAASIQRNQLWRNNQNGNFDRITQGQFVSDANISRSVQWVDYDQDGDVDLWVSNEENQPNYLYENQDGIYTKNLGLGLNNMNRSSTGSSWGDVDNDGDLDLFIANYNQGNQLFINNGDQGFEEMLGTALNEQSCSFGSAFGDFDNDGDLDLFVTNGFCSGNLTNFLYKNNGNGLFTKDQNSIKNLSTNCSFGTAWGDMNMDGYLDLVVANCKGNNFSSAPNSLFQNNGGSNSFIKFKLEGVQSNRSAIGAIVRIKANINGNDIWQMRRISGQSGYNGQNSLTVHFGLADATTVDSIIVNWPNGLDNVYTDFEVNKVYVLTESIINNVFDLENTISNHIKIYPNPVVTNTLNYFIEDKSNFGDHSSIKVIDCHGHLISRFPLAEASGTLDLDALSPGIYFIEFTQDNNKKEILRFIKQ